MIGNNGSYSLNNLLDETNQKLRQTYKSVGVEVDTLSMVWGHTCIFIGDQLVKGKAVTLPNLGTFSYLNKKTELGNRGTKITRIPIFITADSFCQSYNMKKETIPSSYVSVPSIGLNNSLLASQSSTIRDVVVDFQKEAMRCIGSAIRLGKNVSIEFEGIGYLGVLGGALKMTFNTDFVAAILVSGNSPTKYNIRASSPSEDRRSDTNDYSPSPSFHKALPPKQNNFTLPSSRLGTPNLDASSNGVTLPYMELPDRPRAPSIKTRASSESSLLQSPLSMRLDELDDDISKKSDNAPRFTRAESPTISPLLRRINEDKKDDEEEKEDGCCEDCVLAAIKERQARQRRAQERELEEQMVRTQKSVLQALEDKEQMNKKILRARREDMDTHNRCASVERMDANPKPDHYGEVLYSRKPDIPAHVKKAEYNSVLQQQMSDKQARKHQKQRELRKEYEVLQETQKQADERVRKQKHDEKARHKEHSEFLLQQMLQKPKEAPLPSFVASGTPALSHDAQRPTTAARELKRRSFDLTALGSYKESIEQKKQNQADAKMKSTAESEQIRQALKELQQKEHEQEIQRKANNRENLKSAWETQLEHKRQTVLAELRAPKPPNRLSLDLGELTLKRGRSRSSSDASSGASSCRKCGRTVEPPKVFRRTSGDYRLTTSEVMRRKPSLLASSN